MTAVLPCGPLTDVAGVTADATETAVLFATLSAESATDYRGNRRVSLSDILDHYKEKQ